VSSRNFIRARNKNDLFIRGLLYEGDFSAKENIFLGDVFAKGGAFQLGKGGRFFEFFKH
jgi:hypothetical protein